MKDGDWLRRAGPFEVSETASAEIEGEAEFWRDLAEAEREESAALTEQLKESNRLIELLCVLSDDE